MWDTYLADDSKEHSREAQVSRTAQAWVEGKGKPACLVLIPVLISCSAQRLKFRLNLYELKEGRQIKPQTFMSMVSNLLYERRFGPYYTEPVIAGLDPVTHEPFICSLDLIGCPMVTDDFVVSGTCSEQMYGMCESLWEPDMEPDHLFETISQAMLNAVDRDAISGMGVVVHIIEKDKITTRTLKARMD
ncbi:proteasome subunit beta type-3 [Empidonax traillii]|uniref:proteasome subunit beta type-3 n=1 Tax=Empidonax traillii TaxID=164674 RepID=UPI000FFCFB35|nr:proteasome subunit beta type-3 [Empidonax traillii]